MLDKKESFFPLTENSKTFICGAHAQLNISANVKIQIIDVDSKQVIEEINKKNLVVTSGLNLIIVNNRFNPQSQKQ